MFLQHVLVHPVHYEGLHYNAGELLEVYVYDCVRIMYALTRKSS